MPVGFRKENRMHKIYYQYNEEKSCFERIYPTLLQRTIGLLKGFIKKTVVLLSVVAAVLWLYDTYWIEYRYRKQKSSLIEKCQELETQLNNAYLVTSKLSERDKNLYRVMVQAEPLAEEELLAINITELKDSTDESIIKSIENRVAQLQKKMALLSESYDEIGTMYANQGEKWQCIPSIRPIRSADLRQFSSGYGLRLDPITGEAKMHSGLDFVAPQGSDILATGAGTITFADWKEGFGYTVIIDHGFGYETLYAHQEKLLVRKGQSIKRGDIIGLVGSSGRSTGPHLHYEVHLLGRTINPVHFFSKELSPHQYDHLLRESAYRAGTLD